MVTVEIGALVVMEATWPRDATSRERMAAAKHVLDGIFTGNKAGRTARLSFEVDKVEWVVMLSREELEAGGKHTAWARLDNTLALALRAAVTMVREAA